MLLFTEHLLQRSSVLRRQIPQRRTRQSNVNIPCAANLLQHLEVLLHRLRVSARDRTAERLCRAQPRVVCQSLPENRQHSRASRLSIHSSRASHALTRREQSSQQRRCKHSPRVVGLFIFLANRERMPF
jgi:hypothetical protein